MQCREVRELLDAFLGDQLLVETTNDLVRHLEGCPACRTELEGRRALRARLQSAFAGAVPLAPTPEFLNGLEARLRAHQTSRMTRRSWLRSWGAAAAAMITVISGGLFARGALHRSRLAALARNAAGDHQNCAIKFNLSERPISLEEGRAPLRSSVRIVHDLARPRRVCRMAPRQSSSAIRVSTRVAASLMWCSGTADTSYRCS
jgi:hypothetical protein